jgi:CheY-like chemotaxis protein
VSADERFATGGDTVRVEPGDEVAAKVAGAHRGRVLVDVGSSGGLEAIAALRAAGVAEPIAACVALPDRADAVPLGLVETTPRSLDPDAVLAILGAHPGRTRVLAVGGDPDRLLSVRQALTRAQLSMSIAWDTKQADDLFRLVRPDVVIVDLALPARGGHRVALRLRTLDPRPLALLVPADGEDAAAAFAAVAREPGQPTPALPHARVVDAIE